MKISNTVYEYRQIKMQKISLGSIFKDLLEKTFSSINPSMDSPLPL
jgi:hypothetical protein